ncbi:MAG TPA: PepSY-like domain-containing protein [Chitinophagaceae bacterium]|jgi:hypothetical protein|nr:PepSY-like domain-containing protein [Chitinophagaceae bacterium]
MKQQFLFLCAFASLLSCSDEGIPAAEVPAVVRNAVQQQYPGADFNWEQEGGQYKARVETKSGEEWQVQVSATGKVLGRSTSIPVAALPEPVRRAVRQRYGGYRITEAGRLAGAGRTLYQLVLESRKGRGLVVVLRETGAEKTDTTVRTTDGRN